MKSLSTHLEEYLELRHQLGFDLRVAGGLLRKFVLFAHEKGASFITRELALAWATQPGDCQPVQWANRLAMVRRFAQHLSATDPRTEIPPQELLPHRSHRKAPYLYTDQEVRSLIQTARQIASSGDLRDRSHATLLGLLVVTGMRVSEAIGLDRKDVNLTQGLLTIRNSKFNKSRLVPVHHTTHKELRAYECDRDRILPRPSSLSFFISERGTRLTDFTLRQWFVMVSRRIGLRGPTDRRGPRLHDLRHRFAYRTLLSWYKRGLDVEAHLPELATFLGHGHVADTYWYISAAPELLRVVTERLERRKSGYSS